MYVIKISQRYSCFIVYHLRLLWGSLTFFSFFFFNHTYSRWTSSLPSCLWSQRIFPSLPGSRLTIFYRDASSALLQLVNQWLNLLNPIKPSSSVVFLRTATVPNYCNFFDKIRPDGVDAQKRNSKFKCVRNSLRVFKRKIRTRLDLLSIPLSGGKKCQNV